MYSLHFSSVLLFFQLYSGFLQVTLDNYLKGYDSLLYQLGYEKTDSEYQLKAKVPQEKRVELAFECHLAQQELKVYTFLLQNVESLGCSLQHVYTCRTKHPADLNDSIDWIKQQYGPQEHNVKFTTELYQKGASEKKLAEGTRHDFEAKNEPLLKTLPSPLPVSPNSGYHHFSEYDPGTPQTVSRHSTATKDTANEYHHHIAAESLRVRLEQEVASPPHPVTPEDSNTTDWHDVNQFKSKLGNAYNDPGGRGDILKNPVKADTRQTPQTVSKSKVAAYESHPTPYVQISSKKPEEKAFFKPATAEKKFQSRKRAEPSSPWNADTDVQSFLDDKGRTFKELQPQMTSFGHEIQRPVEVSRSPSISSQDRFILESKPGQKQPVHDVASRFYDASAFSSLPAASSGNRTKMGEHRPGLKRISHLGSTIDDDDEENRANQVWQCQHCTFANPLSSRKCDACQKPRGKKY